MLKLQKYRKLHVAPLTLVLCLSFGILLFNWAVNAIYNYRTVAIQTYNALAADLDAPPVPADSLESYDLTTLLPRTSALIQMLAAVARTQDLQREKETIIDTFDHQVSTYRENIRVYATQVGFDSQVNLETIEFSSKKDPEAFIARMKQNFRERIIEYNRTAPDPLRYGLDITTQMSLLTTEQKLAQLFQFSIGGQTLNDHTRLQLLELQPAGVSLFGENISSPEQLRQFTTQIQQTNPMLPLFIAADQEGGMVKRLWWEPGGSQREVAQLKSEQICDVYLNRSQVLRIAGVNWNLGIVADVTSDPASFIYPRTFADDFVTAATNVSIATACTDSTLSTLKHWPGHGATDVDTHSQLGIINVTQDVWQTNESKPFQTGIDKQADTVMVGHLIMPWMDSSRPASVCRQCLQYLRENMHFAGLIVTDDLNMLINSGYGERTEIVRQALLAGNDLIVINVSDRDGQQQLINVAKELVDTQQISAEELNARLARILTAKNKVIKFNNEFVPAELVF